MKESPYAVPAFASTATAKTLAIWRCTIALLPVLRDRVEGQYNTRSTPKETQESCPLWGGADR